MKVKEFIEELKKLDQEKEIRIQYGESTKFGDIDYMAFNIAIENSLTYEEKPYYLLVPECTKFEFEDEAYENYKKCKKVFKELGLD